MNPPPPNPLPPGEGDFSDLEYPQRGRLYLKFALVPFYGEGVFGLLTKASYTLLISGCGLFEFGIIFNIVLKLSKKLEGGQKQ